MKRAPIRLNVLTVILLSVSSVCLFTSEVRSQITSVDDQIKDVSAEDYYYRDLKNLVEKYGCIVPYPDGTFRARSFLTRYEFASGFNSCLDRLMEFAAANGSGEIMIRKISGYQTLLSNGSRQTITSVSQFPDVSPTDWAFQSLQSLVERYSMVFGLPDGRFGGNELLTQAQFADYMNGVFSYDKVPGKREPLTRGDYAVYLNRSLDHALRDLH